MLILYGYLDLSMVFYGFVVLELISARWTRGDELAWRLSRKKNKKISDFMRKLIFHCNLQYICCFKIEKALKTMKTNGFLLFQY